MLPRVDGLAVALAAAELVPQAGDAVEELPLVVERGHVHVPPLVPRWVVPVMAHDVAQRVVVSGIDSGHTPRVGRPAPMAEEWEREGGRPGGHACAPPVPDLPAGGGASPARGRPAPPRRLPVPPPGARRTAPAPAPP